MKRAVPLWYAFTFYVIFAAIALAAGAGWQRTENQLQQACHVLHAQHLTSGGC